jgi:parvulin-like peptidyl-prolyl isomerase
VLCPLQPPEAGKVHNSPKLMQPYRLVKLLPLALLMTSAAATRAQVDPGKTVATVNGEAIKGEEYYRRMEFLPGIGKKDGDSFFEAPPGFLTLEQLITEKLVMQLAKQKGVFPSDLQVQAELKARQEDNPNLLKDWTTNGRTPEELSSQIRFELAQFNIETFGITVTDSEVQKFYTEHPTMYTNPKQDKLRIIVVQDAASRASVDKALAAGTAFADVAKQYSVDITKVAGGDLGQVPHDFLSQSAKDALAKVKIGQSTDWISSETNDNQTRFVKFLLVDVVPESKMTLDAKLKRQIRKQRLIDLGQVKNDIRKDMNALRMKAQINITEPEFAAIYKRFIDAYLKQTGATGGQ